MAKKLDAERIEEARHKGEKKSSRREEQKQANVLRYDNSGGIKLPQYRCQC